MELSDLNQWLDERNLGGHWTRGPIQGKFKPHLWKWKDIYAGLMWANELVPMDTAGRRTITLKNPSLKVSMTNTLQISVQCVLPGEIAKAHRHVMSATRYILKGSPKAFTVVDGERFPVEEGDLITTPNWTWHDHFNNSDEPIIWLDGLDVRLVLYMGGQIHEPYNQDQQPVEKPDEYSSKTLGHARPSWLKNERVSPPFRYRWDETYPTLLALKESEGDPFDGVRLQYVNAFNGGPTLPTFSCEIQLLRSNEKTRSHRHTSTTVYHAFRGRGTTIVNDERLEWEEGDIFVVPPWYWHEHENRRDEDSLLYSITDWPSMVSLGIFREEKR